MIKHDDVPSRTCRDCNLTSSDMELFRKSTGAKYGRQNLCRVCNSKESTGWQHMSVGMALQTKQRKAAAAKKVNAVRKANALLDWAEDADDSGDMHDVLLAAFNAVGLVNEEDDDEER